MIGIGEELLIQYADDTTINIVSNSFERLEIQGFECMNTYLVHNIWNIWILRQTILNQIIFTLI